MRICRRCLGWWLLYGSYTCRKHRVAAPPPPDGRLTGEVVRWLPYEHAPAPAPQVHLNSGEAEARAMAWSEGYSEGYRDGTTPPSGHVVGDFEIAVDQPCPACSCPWQGEPTRPTERCSDSRCICHSWYWL